MAIWEYILAKELFEFKEWMGGHTSFISFCSSQFLIWSESYSAKWCYESILYSQEVLRCY